MNRIIALIIPLVLLVAMGLIVLQQMKSPIMQPETLKTTPPVSNSTIYPYPAHGTSITPQEATTNSTAAPVPPTQRNGVPSNWSLPGYTSTPNKGQKATPPVGASNSTAEQSNLGRMAAAMGAQNTQSHKGEGAAAKNTEKENPAADGKKKSTEGKEKDKAKDKDKDKSADKSKASTSGKKQTMKSIKLTPKGKDILLVLDSKEKIEYKTFMLKTPERLVVDIAGEWSNLSAPGVPANNLVKGIRLGNQEKGRRIVLDLKEKPKGYEVKRDGEKVIVRIY